MNKQVYFEAEYLSPGSFYPETVKVARVGDLTPAELVRNGPNAPWHAVRVSRVVERLCHYDGDEDSPTESFWQRVSTHQVHSLVIGEKLTLDGVEKLDESVVGRTDILLRNMRRNNWDFVVRTRCGNWQPASDFGAVISAEEATRLGG